MKNIKIGRFVDPSKDAGFKALLCDKDNIDVLKLLINSFLPSDRQVVELQFESDREVPGITVSDKVIRVDLRCKDEQGRTFIVEMQRQPQVHFVKRCVHYASRVYSSQLSTGTSYGELEPVYIISILNNPLKEEIPGTGKAIARYSFCESTDKDFAFDEFYFIFVRLDLAKKTLEECKTEGERCLHYLAHMNGMKDYPDDEVFKDFFRKAEIAAFTPEKKDQYIADMITERDYENILYTANLMGEEKGLEAGRAEGLEAGRAEGLEKGMAKGRAEGMEKARIETAKNMKAMGMSDDVISKCTGLPLEQVQKL